MASVVDVHKDNLVKMGYKDFSDWISREENIYVGRDMSFFVPGTFNSKWRNQYPVKMYGLEKSLQNFENDILKSNDLLFSLHELKGKNLGCWCVNTNHVVNKGEEKCHGQVLLRLINNL